MSHANEDVKVGALQIALLAASMGLIQQLKVTGAFSHQDVRELFDYALTGLDTQGAALGAPASVAGARVLLETLQAQLTQTAPTAPLPSPADRRWAGLR